MGGPFCYGLSICANKYSLRNTLGGRSQAGLDVPRRSLYRQLARRRRAIAWNRAIHPRLYYVHLPGLSMQPLISASKDKSGRPYTSQSQISAFYSLDLSFLAVL